VGSIGKAEESISESVTAARGSADSAANSANEAAASSSAAQTSERDAANSATQASQSATAAKQSETNAAESAQTAASSERNSASSAEQAANIVASVSGSVTQAENAARSASQSATAAAGSASAAGGSAQAAADSASKAGESATAAGLSERNAAQSAVQAAQSATDAAQSASDAKNAVNGFGLEVGTTTTGDPGTDAAVEIQKTGTKYTTNFTIPRGDKGEPASVEHDDTLTGDGTGTTPLGQAGGYVISKPVKQSEAPVDEVPYSISIGRNDMPSKDYGPLINIKGYSGEDAALFFPHSASNGIDMWLGSRIGGAWSKGGWRQIAFKDDTSGTIVNPKSQSWNAIDFNDFKENGVYTFNGSPTNSPKGDNVWITGTVIVVHSIQRIMQLCAYFPSEPRPVGFAFRDGDFVDVSNIKWTKWRQIAFTDDLPQTPALANETGDVASLSTRVQALEVRIKSLETNQ
jgi:hypothetical protein